MGAWYSNVVESAWGNRRRLGCSGGGHGRSIVPHNINEQQTMPPGGSKKRGGPAGRGKEAPPAKRTRTQMVVPNSSRSPPVHMQPAAVANSGTPTLATHRGADQYEHKKASTKYRG